MRIMLAILAGLTLAGVATGMAQAQGTGGPGAAPGAEGYPSKPVRIMVGLAAGGGVDLIARLVAPKLQLALGQPFLVENKPGANTIIANEYVARSEPDGYTLLMGATSGFSMNPHLYAKLPYDPIKDIVPVGGVVVQPLVVVVHPSVPAQSVKELIAYAKANPGKLNYGAGATTFHVATEMFLQMAGIDVSRIPYKGSAPAAAALVGGEVQMAVIDSTAVMPHLKSGRVRGLAVTTATRSELVPGLPTVAEAGVPGYEMTVNINLFAPAGVPRDIIAKLNAELKRFVQMPDVREKVTAMGQQLVGSSPEEVAAIIRSESARFGPVIRKANITIQ